MKVSVAMLAALATVPGVLSAVLWDGRFNDMTSEADLDKWSWGNQVGPYQWYIKGSSPTSDYVSISAEHANPDDAASSKGARFTLDSTAYWNGQNMRRVELIPQTTAAIASGKVFYHFSMMRTAENAPSISREHQICFFESHFTEMKYGWISGEQAATNPNLQWMVSQKTYWKKEWEPGVWHNIAYEIDFSAGTVGFWHSEGGAPLTQVVAPVSASPSSNGADWHLGVLELPRSGHPDTDEDFYFSGVYIESGPITTIIGEDGGTTTPPTTTEPDNSGTTTTTSAAAATTSAAAPSEPEPEDCVSQWAQCGGQGYTGPICCSSGTCTFSNQYYSQCI